MNGHDLKSARWLVGLCVLSFGNNCCFATTPSGGVASTIESSNDSSITDRISRLIDQLGSDHYATRRQAQDQLQQIGVPALDQLQAAIVNSDPQVATLARYLIRSSFINWTNENDPLEVRKLLEHYGTGDVTYRDERIARLASIDGDRGLPALLRIARFEIEGRLSRRAALLILEADRKRSKKRAHDQKHPRWEIVLAAASEGHNQACEWLAEFARGKTASVPMNPTFWIAAINAESELLRAKSTETSREFLELFSRFVCEEFVESGRRDEALKIGMGLLEIQYHDRERIHHALDLCLWALEKNFPEIVIEQFKQPWIQNVRHTQLDYLRAESHLRLGEREQAEELAERAFSRGGESDVLLYNRAVHAEFLKVRQQYAWAEREYRAALKISEPHDALTVKLIYFLSFMLVDGLDHAGAVEVMRPMIERFEKEPAFARDIDNDPIFSLQGGLNDDQETATYTASLRALYLHYRAQDKIKAGKLSEAKQDLRDALKVDPNNVDVAITMWKNRDDAGWNREGENAIEQSIIRFQAAIPKLERALRASGPSDLATYQDEYADALNTYAWVLVCTDRDLESALECSQRACRLLSKAAYLDTLARCYFKVGRTDEAIQSQMEAIAIEPYSREISRSLAEYQAALQK